MYSRNRVYEVALYIEIVLARPTKDIEAALQDAEYSFDSAPERRVSKVEEFLYIYRPILLISRYPRRIIDLPSCRTH
jgi:hypothetical protein